MRGEKRPQHHASVGRPPNISHEISKKTTDPSVVVGVGISRTSAGFVMKSRLLRMWKCSLFALARGSDDEITAAERICCVCWKIKRSPEIWTQLQVGRRDAEPVFSAVESLM